MRKEAPSYGNNFSSDETKDALVEGVLDKYGITQAELDSSLVWYSDNIELYRSINDSVASRLRAKSDLLRMEKDKRDLRSNTTSSYVIPPYFTLNKYTPTMSFNIDSLRIKSINMKDFHLTFDVQGINKYQDVEAVMLYTYKDTLIKQLTRIDKNDRYYFAKPHRADSLLQNVSGYVHLLHKDIELPSNIILYNINYIDSLASQRGLVESPAVEGKTDKAQILDTATVTKEVAPVINTPTDSSSSDKNPSFHRSRKPRELTK